jgi:hypothetical protein
MLAIVPNPINPRQMVTFYLNYMSNVKMDVFNGDSTVITKDLPNVRSIEYIDGNNFHVNFYNDNANL